MCDAPTDQRRDLAPLPVTFSYSFPATRPLPGYSCAAPLFGYPRLDDCRKQSRSTSGNPGKGKENVPPLCNTPKRFGTSPLDSFSAGYDVRDKIGHLRASLIAVAPKALLTRCRAFDLLREVEVDAARAIEASVAKGFRDGKEAASREADARQLETSTSLPEQYQVISNWVDETYERAATTDVADLKWFLDTLSLPEYEDAIEELLDASYPPLAH